MKKIIVPTDFSDLSTHALDFAIKLAAKLDAEVDLLHLEEVPLGDLSLHLTGEASGSHISEDSLYNAQLFRANNKKLANLKNSYQQEGVTVKTRQYGGGFLNGIKHFIETEGGDLVVIGTTGEESIQEFFSGNHTEQLIEHISVPVISIQDRLYHEIEDIVLGLDMEDENYSHSAFEMVKVIVEALKATLHIVSITRSKDDEELLYRLNALAQNAGVTNFMIDVIEDSNTRDAFLEYAGGVDAGLLIAITEAKPGINRFLQQSFATRLTKSSSIPVMTINKRLLSKNL